MSLLIPDIGFAKIETESTYGTDPNNNPIAINLRDTPEAEEIREQITRERVKSTVGGDPHAIHKIAVDFSFTTTVAPPEFVDAGTPAIAPILKASGHSETTSGDTNNPPVTATYSPEPRAHDSMTVKFYLADKDSPTDYSKITITGARCTWTLQHNSGSEIILEVEGRGLYATWDQLTDLSGEEPSTTHKGQTPFTSPNQTFSHGTADNFSSFEFSPAFSTNDQTDATADESVEEVFLRPDGRASGSYDPITETVGATDDPRDLHRTANQSPLDLTIENPGATDRLKFSAPNTQLTESGLDSGDGHFRYSSSFECNEDSGDDDYSLVFEADS